MLAQIAATFLVNFICSVASAQPTWASVGRFHQQAIFQLSRSGEMYSRYNVDLMQKLGF